MTRAGVFASSILIACGAPRPSGEPDAAAGAADARADDAATIDADPADGHAIQVAAGEYHTCAVTARRGVKCWGRNDHGQLGDGTTTSALVPVSVVGLENVVSIAVGGLHSCALTAEGAVRCWGYNLDGEVGDGSTQHAVVPTPVVGLGAGVKAIAVRGNAFTTCALTQAGGVRCWGHNTSGQLGNNSTADNSAVPVPVHGLSSGVESIAVAFDHACAVTDAGGVQCWGYNNLGQLGAGSPAALSRVPVPVLGLGSGVAAIAAANLHTCALTTFGGVQCWGQGEAGALGDGAMQSASIPVPVSGLATGVTAIFAGEGYTYALGASGPRHWGLDHQEWHPVNPTYASVPQPVAGLPAGIQAFAPGAGYECALTTGGSIWCWGHNTHGQLGTGTTWFAADPAPVVGFP